jgi:hypothetical protein
LGDLPPLWPPSSKKSPAIPAGLWFNRGLLAVLPRSLSAADEREKDTLRLADFLGLRLAIHAVADAGDVAGRKALALALLLNAEKHLPDIVWHWIERYFERLFGLTSKDKKMDRERVKHRRWSLRYGESASVPRFAFAPVAKILINGVNCCTHFPASLGDGREA